MAMIDLTAVGLVARHRLAVPTTELSANGWPSAPVRGSPARRPPRCDLRPAWRGLGPWPLEGLGAGLTGDGARQGEAPGLRLQPPVAVGPWEALRRDLPAPHVVHRRLPVLLPAADTRHAVGAAGPPALQTGRGEIGAQGFCRKVRFWGKIQKSGVRNSMAYRCQHSRKSNFATEPSTEPRDMRLPGLNLHPLGGDRVGEWAVSVSGNWRVTFRFEGTDAVSVNYEDYP